VRRRGARHAVTAVARRARRLHYHRHMATNTSHTMDVTTKILLVIAIIGAVNWGLIGFFNFNLVDAIFGGGAIEQTSAFSRVIYAIVGLAGVAAAVMLPRLKSVEHRRLADRPI
jgi:uncharacterized membrane protein YuzA (DUF378 family)